MGQGGAGPFGRGGDGAGRLGLGLAQLGQVQGGGFFVSFCFAFSFIYFLSPFNPF